VVYKNAVDCIIKIIKTEGVKKLYAGAVGNILRGIGGSLILVLYDDMRKAAESLIGKE